MLKFTIEMENGDVMYGELYPDVAPVTVDNFVKLANSGFYDGLIFHRVIPGFMIQGGDPTGTGMGGSPEKIKGEFLANGFPNKLKHERGVISMARSADMNSASSQFFIMVDDSPHLDGQYAAFGKVLGGIEAADKIVEVRRDVRDKPREDQVMKTIKVEEVDHIDVEVKVEPTLGFTLEMENGGVITGELYPETAPITVANFRKLANSGFYDGLIFHRVIPGFMIQGGDPLGTGMGGAPEKIKGEFSANGVTNRLKHKRGVISMARSADPNSASSQFFIMVETSPHLDGQYAAFGKVLSGMEVADEIAETSADARDKPRVDQVIKSIRVEE